MSNIVFTWSNLPEGYCWKGPQTYMDDIFNLLGGDLPGGVTVIAGDTLPGPDEQADIWVRLNPDGTLEGIYKFQGVWHRPHPTPPSGQQVIIWKGTEDDLKTYDGGSDEAVTDFTGPMWQRDTDFDFLIPIGIGTNPTSYDGNPATVIAAGDLGGEERVTLTVDELGTKDHVHVFGRMRTNAGGPSGDNVDLVKGDITESGLTGRRVTGAAEAAVYDPLDDQTGDWLNTGKAIIPGGSDAAKSHQNMPPYRGVIFAKRTARKFYTVI